MISHSDVTYCLNYIRGYLTALLYCNGDDSTTFQKYDIYLHSLVEDLTDQYVDDYFTGCEIRNQEQQADAENDYYTSLEYWDDVLKEEFGDDMDLLYWNTE